MFGTKLKLPVHGQGVFLFKATGKEDVSFSIVGTNKIHVSFTSKINVTSYPGGPLVDPNNKTGLSTAPGAYYWFSIDSQNQNICAGVGEPRLETLTYKYLFTPPQTHTKSLLENLTHIVVVDGNWGDAVSKHSVRRDDVTVAGFGRLP